MNKEIQKTKRLIDRLSAKKIELTYQINVALEGLIKMCPHKIEDLIEVHPKDAWAITRSHTESVQYVGLQNTVGAVVGRAWGMDRSVSRKFPNEQLASFPSPNT